ALTGDIGLDGADIGKN
ncbi:hypothetical protein SEEH4316_03381, partial [Salmonella enterica subsp. enterica serovar Heidelberg str. RI-11-014316]